MSPPSSGTPNGINPLHPDDPADPGRLRNLPDPPQRLYIRGMLPHPDRPHLAVVGTRRATPYGRKAVKSLVTPLARSGVVIVSGLAYGIDAEAHRCCLEAGGTTVAVLGCGIDRAYPAAHAGLATQILRSGGTVVSEYPPGTPSFAGNFPARNRIVAALSHAVLVVEAPEKSGALITAYLAAELGREVLAVPGPFGAPNSVGVHALLSRGARIATGIADLADALGLDTERINQQNRATVSTACSEPAQKILTAVGTGTPTLEELTGSTDLPTARVFAAVTELEIKGLLSPLGDGRYAATPAEPKPPNAQPRHRRVAHQGEEDKGIPGQGF